MCNLKLPALVFVLSVVLHCVSAAPSNRYSPVSSEQPDMRESWLLPGFSKNSFHSFTGASPEGDLTTAARHMEKRKCNTATCVTQRLADFLIRSSNTIGTVYSPTNVGSNTYGKRDVSSVEPFKYLQL
ncbi:islet amyloid polypeptide isoform X2 [Amia ocellicauda]|uniref:islet amyloid polypeptide isoform X2 n=1 Tax=Amia ocellicauda TaxID=2972642 RepID=UPI003463DDBF